MNVIFVCTGNTCRSPLAESLARRMSEERGLKLTFASAGTGAALGAPATDAAILVGLERGVDLSRHRSRPLLPGAIRPDTVVLAMASGHLAGIRATAPSARVYLIDEFASRGASAKSVDDPYGGDLEDYRRAADEIEALLTGVLDRIATERAAGSA